MRENSPIYATTKKGKNDGEQKGVGRTRKSWISPTGVRWEQGGRA